MVFDINKFSKFKDKIIYNVVDKQPSNIVSVNENDDYDTKAEKLINNSNKREHYQREMALKSLDEADPNDIILINDVDEIPNLDEINFKNIYRASLQIIESIDKSYPPPTPDSSSTSLLLH